MGGGTASDGQTAASSSECTCGHQHVIDVLRAALETIAHADEVEFPVPHWQVIVAQRALKDGR